MRDIVETIQAEQDQHHPRRPGRRAGRAGRPRHRQDRGRAAPGGVPALHVPAAAVHPRRADRRPERRPSCATSRRCCRRWPRPACCCAPLGDLFPGVVAGGTEPDAAAEVKGRAGDGRGAGRRGRRPAAGARTSRWRSSSPATPPTGTRSPSTRPPAPPPGTGPAAPASRTTWPGSSSTPEIVTRSSLQLADRIGADPYADDPLGERRRAGRRERCSEEADLAEIRRELRADPGVLTALDWLWPVLTPQQLLTDLYAAPDRIATAAPGLTAAEQALLARGSDGRLDPGRRAAARRGWPSCSARTTGTLELLAELRHRQQVAYAEGALEIVHGSRSLDLEDEIDPEILTATDLLDAGQLAERQADADRLTAAERAAADRTWAFGHVIVDEAQELSPMAWRLLMRRCPSRSMTLVGDVAQTGDPAGTSSWAATSGPVRRGPLAADRAHRQLPHPGRDHGAGRSAARRHRPGAAPAPLGPRDRRPAAGDRHRPRRADRRGGGRGPGRAGPGRRRPDRGARPTVRHRPGCRAGRRAAGRPGRRRPGQPGRRPHRPAGQGSRVRHRGRGRPGGHRGRVRPWRAATCTSR